MTGCSAAKLFTADGSKIYWAIDNPYVGSVGTGFSDSSLEAAYENCKANKDFIQTSSIQANSEIANGDKTTCKVTFINL